MDQTISLHWVKVLNFIKINESQESFGTEMRSKTESKLEIEGIHLHHKDMSNELKYTSKSNGQNNLPPNVQSVEFY